MRSLPKPVSCDGRAKSHRLTFRPTRQSPQPYSRGHALGSGVAVTGPFLPPLSRRESCGRGRLHHEASCRDSSMPFFPNSVAGNDAVNQQLFVERSAMIERCTEAPKVCE